MQREGRIAGLDGSSLGTASLDPFRGRCISSVEIRVVRVLSMKGWHLDTTKPFVGGTGQARGWTEWWSLVEVESESSSASVGSKVFAFE